MNIEEDYIKKAKDIFRLINDFRRNPKILSKHLENLRRYLDTSSNVLSEPGKIQVQMVEGEMVINEAIDFLNSLPQLKPLNWDENLAMSAMEHVIDIGPKGLLSYQSSDGTEPEERICKYGNYVESLGENIDFGPNDSIGVIVSLTLDDGEADRPHRDNLFKSEYQKVGIACGPHKTEYQMCVMDFAYDFLGFDEDADVDVITNNEKENSINFLQNGNKNDNNVNKNSKKNFVRNNLIVNNNIKNTNKNTNNDFVDPGMTANFSKNNLQNNEYTILPKKDYSSNIKNYEDTFGYNHNKSPLVRLAIEEPKKLNHETFNSKTLINEDEALISQMRLINLEKRVVSKLVEVTTRIVYTYEDGSIKEVIEKQNHNFNI